MTRRPSIVTAIALGAAAAVALPAASQAAPRVVNACMVTTNAKCPGAKLQGQNLAGVNMSKSNLKGANMKGANLKGAKFAGANLQGANLRNADIRGVDFTGANLKGANFRGTKAGPPQGAMALGTTCNAGLQNTGGSMVKAALQNANLSSVNYSYWDFDTAKLSGANMTSTNFTCATFTSVNMTAYAWVNNNTGTCVYPAEKTVLTKTNFSGADMTGTQAAGWSYSKVSSQTACSGGSYTPSTSYSPDLSAGYIANANLTNVNFHYTKLPTGSSNTALYTGALWSNTTCPNGTTQSTQCPPSP